jgi:site-specific recombinase XerD
MMTLKKAVSQVMRKEELDIISLRYRFAKACPKTILALNLLDCQYHSDTKRKGYALVKRDHTKLGFTYCVRYWHEGIMLSSKWSCHTNNYEQACLFAETHREALISRYLGKNNGGVSTFLRNFYSVSSRIYQSERKRNGELSEGRRKRYESVMTNKFLPFLRKRGIRSFDTITAHLLDDFQDVLLGGGLKPQSVNDAMTALQKAFRYLFRKGMVQENPCKKLSPVPEKQEDRKTHGCYETDKLKGVFNKRWKDKLSRLLNLMIYTTDMRNSEIRRFRVCDIIEIRGCHFIDLKHSKTENGVRLVPLHETVWRTVLEYARGQAITEHTPVFASLSSYRFTKAYQDLGKVLGLSREYLKEHNITYYSGRHFWKTLMNACGLGEGIEEIFMGHRVSGDVAKLYNHRDMQGRRLLVKKAREVFRILDRKLFSKKSD